MLKQRKTLTDHLMAVVLWVVFVPAWAVACPICLNLCDGLEVADPSVLEVIDGYVRSPIQMVMAYPLCLLVFILNLLMLFLMPLENGIVMMCVSGVFLVAPCVLACYTDRLAVWLSDRAGRVLGWTTAET